MVVAVEVDDEDALQSYMLLSLIMIGRWSAAHDTPSQ